MTGKSLRIVILSYILLNYPISTSSSTLFAYDFFGKPLPTGYYTLVVSAQKAGSSAATTVEIKTNILTSIDIVNAELTISDADVGNKITK